MSPSPASPLPGHISVSHPHLYQLPALARNPSNPQLLFPPPGRKSPSPPPWLHGNQGSPNPTHLKPSIRHKQWQENGGMAAQEQGLC